MSSRTFSGEASSSVEQQQMQIKEELKEEDYVCGGTLSTPMDQSDDGIQKLTKEEELHEDSLYCELCKSFFINKCEVHGPALFISDTAVPMGLPNRARQTLPPGLELQKSGITHIGLGVFNTMETIPVGAHFGPYEGDLVHKEEAMNSGYSWVMYQSKQREKLLDATAERNSNWMRYVNCARNEDEQNLVAFRYRGEILYRCRRPIQPGQELLVWYLGVTFDKIWKKGSKNEMSNQVFSCSLCPLSYTVEIYLHKHIKRCHVGEYSRLLKSGLIKDKTLTPVRKASGEIRQWRKVHRCSECGKSFGKPSHLELHRRVHTREKPYHCLECGRNFSYLTTLKQHQRLHTGEKPYLCSHCGRSFTHWSSLQLHQRLHTGEKPYRCSECGKSFTQQMNYKQHQRVHTGERPFRCSQCGKRFTKQINLQRHERIHTGEKPYDCSQCGKSFNNRSTLIQHCRVHTGEKPYRCLECGKSFTHQGSLHAHQRIHSGEKPFLCLECGKSFTYLNSLKRHQNIHSGDKSYRCLLCGQGFSSQKSLKQHHHVHTGERPYRCSLCEKGFSSQSSLKRHEHVHTGEKPYQCLLCGKGFSSQSCLKRHHRIHTGDKPYRCSLCGKGFSSQSSQQQHQHLHTREHLHQHTQYH